MNRTTLTLSSATVNSATINGTNSKRTLANTEALKYCKINSETWNIITLK